MSECCSSAPSTRPRLVAERQAQANQQPILPIVAILRRQVNKLGQVGHKLRLLLTLFPRHGAYQKAAPAETLAIQPHAAQQGQAQFQ